MKRPRKPSKIAPIVFYRARWCIGYHNRTKPHTATHRALFRMYLYNLPQPPKQEETQ